MGLIIDQQYAGMLNQYVRNFNKKGRTYKFSCPICGDSATNRTKARGYLYPGNDCLIYKCHNCSTPVYRLKDLLAFLDNNLAEQYSYDTFAEGKASPAICRKPTEAPIFDASINQSLIRTDRLPSHHKVVEYLNSRAIPVARFDLLYYTSEFKKFANSVSAETYGENSLKYEESRLVIPLIGKHQSVNGYQGRSLADQAAQRYITILTPDSPYRYYGLDRLDSNRKTIVVEGPLDSLFLNNAVATAGGRLDSLITSVGLSADRSYVVYDNEPRNCHTIKKMLQAANAGYYVCVWPGSILQKDINQMIQAGLPAKGVEQIIFANSYRGLRAKLEIQNWKRI